MRSTCSLKRAMPYSTKLYSIGKRIHDGEARSRSKVIYLLVCCTPHSTDVAWSGRRTPARFWSAGTFARCAEKKIFDSFTLLSRWKWFIRVGAVLHKHTSNKTIARSWSRLARKGQKVIFGQRWVSFFFFATHSYEGPSVLGLWN